jgi:GNAT superfamily N-acetyltransferase
MNVSIEPYKPSHQSSIESLILSIQQVEYGIDIDMERQADLRDIANYYQTNKGNFWVAYSNDTLVGTIALLDIGNGQAALRKMFVHPEYRGKLYGVSAALLETLLQWVEENNIRQVLLGTTVHFVAAHRFYEKNGFVKINKNDLPPTFPIMEVDTMFFEKTIA